MTLSIQINPENASLAIMISDSNLQGLSCDISDVKGNKLQTYLLSDPITIVDLKSFADEELIMHVVQKGILLKTFKVTNHI